MKEPVHLRIEFEDGDSRVIPLSKAIEIKLRPERKQSIEFRETNGGEWVMSYSSLMMAGRKLKKIVMEEST